MAKIPFLDKLKRHREGRELDAHQTVIAAARAIATGKPPGDVDAVDDALRTLGQATEFLEDLADLFGELAAAELIAADQAAAEDERDTARKAATDAHAELAREHERLHAAVAAADAVFGRAQTRLDRATTAVGTARNLRRKILATSNPALVEATRERIEALNQEIAALGFENQRQKVEAIRKLVESEERQLKSGGADPALLRRDLDRRRDELRGGEELLERRRPKQEQLLAAVREAEATLQTV